MMTRLVGSLSVLLFSTAALAQAPAKPADAAPPAAGAPAGKAAPPAMPTAPAPELAALSWLVGKWTCDDLAAIAVPPGTAPVKVKSEYEIKQAVNKAWYWGSFTEKKQKDYRGFRGEAYMGWDTVQKKYIFFGFDDMGGWVQLSAATVAPDSVTWTGEGSLGQKAPFRYTWGKKGDKEMSFVLEVQMEGNWIKSSDATCKKK